VGATHVDACTLPSAPARPAHTDTQLAHHNQQIDGNNACNRGALRQPGRQTDRQTDRQAGRQTGRHADRQTCRQTDRQTGRQADRQTGIQADRQTGRHADQNRKCKTHQRPRVC
jgi:hypothetical protein